MRERRVTYGLSPADKLAIDLNRDANDHGGNTEGFLETLEALIKLAPQCEDRGEFLRQRVLGPRPRGAALDIETVKKLLELPTQYERGEDYSEDVKQHNDEIRLIIQTEMIDGVPLVNPGGSRAQKRARQAARHQMGDSQLVSSKGGHDITYLRRRLRHEFPDLYARMIVGELSVWAAALEANLIKPRRSVNIETPEAAVTSLLKVFTAEQLQQALDTLTTEQGGKRKGKIKLHGTRQKR